MKRFLLLIISLFFVAISSAQNPADNLIPTDAVTHEAAQDGDWSDAATWVQGSIPGEGAIVHIPENITVTYSEETAVSLFGIRVDGTFTVSQTDATKTTRLEFDTLYGSSDSLIQFLADGATDGKIEVSITPFDILNHEATVTTGDNAWNTVARAHYSDGATVNKINRTVAIDKKRFNTHDEAVAYYAGKEVFDESDTTVYDDGIGVTGRYGWDPMQMSIGIIIQGQIEVIGQAKSAKIQLAGSAFRDDTSINLSAAPEGWLPGDEILITKSGKFYNTATEARATQTETAILDNVTGSSLILDRKLRRDHEETPDDDFVLRCYVGNLTRNIVFQSGSPLLALNPVPEEAIHHRGHLMVMETNENVQIKNAQFKNMGRSDKSRWQDDIIFKEWVQTDILKSKSSPLGQNVAISERPAPKDITNLRGRYSIHLHKNGSKPGDKLIKVTGNVIWGNPGWGITHHDAYADVSDNVVYDVLGAGIVAETGSETGFWNNNLVVGVSRRPGSGSATDPYNGILFYNDYLFSGQGFGLKGRAVVCNDNVISDVTEGVGIINMNPNVAAVDKVDAEQLATVRPGFTIDQFPLSQNGYSAEGDGVMPVEVALIMNNTTIIGTNIGLKSIEREMGLNHESRSIFDGFIVWGGKECLAITYQADYTFHDTFLSGDRGDNGGANVGLYMWKHSHNHIFDNIKFRDLDYAMVPSKLVLSDGSGLYKTRNNGFTSWYFLDAKTQNVPHFYEIIDEDDLENTLYTEHADNPIHLASSEVTRNRKTTFTMLDEAATGLPYFEITDDLRFTFGAIDYNETDPKKQFGFGVDGIITDQLGAYKFGIEQAAAQDKLRNGYPERLYQFASEAKFLEYLGVNGLYEHPTEGYLYFIINEVVPDRLSTDYTSIPLRIKVLNPPTTGIFAAPQQEPAANFLPKDQLISRLATISQSSTQAGVTVPFNGDDLAVDPNASKAADGNTNGRDNANFLQREETTGVPVGSYSLTEVENQPWIDLDFGEDSEITYIDIWNTVIMKGKDIEENNPDLADFHIMLDDEPFTGKSLAQSLATANWKYHQVDPVGRKLSLDTEVAGQAGRYMRIQKVGANTSLKLAEIEVLGKTELPAVEYIYDDRVTAAWTPEDPSGVATAEDTARVLSGTATLTDDVELKELIVNPEGLANVTLDIATHTVAFTETLTNDGIILGKEGTISYTGTEDASISGTSTSGSETFEIGTLLVNGDGNVAVSTDIDLYTALDLQDGTLDVTASEFRFKSDATKTAVVEPVANGVLVGEVTVEKFYAAKRAFRMIGSSVNTTTSIKDNFQQGVHNIGFNYPADNNNPKPGYGTHITGSVTGENGFDATPSGNPSLFTFNNAGQSFEAAANTDTKTLSTGEPLLLMVRGSRVTDISDNNATPTDTRLEAKGSLQLGTANFAGLNTTAGNFNMLGNPYQASVDMVTLTARGINLNPNQYYIWDSNQGSRGAYVTVLLPSGINTSGSAANQYLQPNQAMFLTTLADGAASLQFEETDKVLNATSQTNTYTSSTEQLIVKLFRDDAASAGNSAQDSFGIFFTTAENENDLNPNDAEKFTNQDETLSIDKGEMLLTIEHRNAPTGGLEIVPLSLTNALADMYRFEVNFTGTFTTSVAIYDKFTDVFHPIESGDTTVLFQMDTDDEASRATDRFEIVFGYEALGVDDINLAGSIYAYPNPLTSDKLNVVLSPELSASSIDFTITNVLGQVVLENTDVSGEMLRTINVDTLSSGTYILTVSSGAIQKRIKIIRN